MTRPAHLGSKAGKLWDSVSSGYELRADELRLLEDACREIDIIERLEDALRDAPLVERGSQGQPVPSPLLTEIRQHRAGLAALLKALKLPDDGAEEKRGETAEEVSSKARKAAVARWSKVTPASGAQA